MLLITFFDTCFEMVNDVLHSSQSVRLDQRVISEALLEISLYMSAIFTEILSLLYRKIKALLARLFIV